MVSMLALHRPVVDEADLNLLLPPPRGLRLPTCSPKDCLSAWIPEEAVQVKSRKSTGGQHEPRIMAQYKQLPEP